MTVLIKSPRVSQSISNTHRISVDWGLLPKIVDRLAGAKAAVLNPRHQHQLQCRCRDQQKRDGATKGTPPPSTPGVLGAGTTLAPARPGVAGQLAVGEVLAPLSRHIKSSKIVYHSMELDKRPPAADLAP